MIGAVDIGGTKIAAGIVDDAGKVLAKMETPTEAARAYTDAWELDRAWIVRQSRFNDTSRSTRIEGARPRSQPSEDAALSPSLVRSRHVIAEYRHTCWPPRP